MQIKQKTIYGADRIFTKSMPPPLILSVSEATIAYANKPIFENLSFNIHQGNKICLIGKNGAGKTTLMKILSGDLELDCGVKWQAPGLSISHLKQEVETDSEQTIFDFIFAALPKEKQNEEYKYMVEMVTEPLLLNAEDKLKDLSGGQLRRAALAQSLIEEPDILLLDEPTNHLDLAGIEWLENYLNKYRGTMLCISHDKRFLENISNKVFWLDRGVIRVCPKGFGYFEEWQEMLLDQEKRELDNRERNLAIEEEWANRGVKARRKRNVRRVIEAKEERQKLDQANRAYRQATQKIALKPQKKSDSSNMIAEFYHSCKSFTDNNKEKIILDKFDYRIMRGDRIGLLGKNGSGKTSFIKMLLGEMHPDQGTIKLGKNIKISYFDQKRRDLNPTESIWKTLCPTGGDYIQVGDKQRHVCGYLKDFLFDPKQAQDPVGSLSGGQQNRLMLAKTLAHPGSLLILDEPTNDLDMDTLEILEEILSHYQGTLVIVSHDRDFLDQMVTKILAFSGEGVIDEYIGNYSDYLARVTEQNEESKRKQIKTTQPENNTNRKKLSYKEKFELDNLPAKISNIEQQIKELENLTSTAEFYDQDHDTISKTLDELAKHQTELEQLELRWLELEESQNN